MADRAWRALSGKVSLADLLNSNEAIKFYFNFYLFFHLSGHSMGPQIALDQMKK